MLAEARTPLILTTIPGKPGRPGRLERLLEEVGAQLGGCAQVSCQPQLLTFNAQAQSNKRLASVEQRIENLKRGMHLHPDFAAAPARYVILDDVLTTGSTLIRARDLLVAAGVPSGQIQGLVLTSALGVSRAGRGAS
ncbi:ComF family protein [Deinococcus sp.]|uniref:ComF family protein n=1 Tax=Deinococcus sp. TaxID=47478 RepID=UPI003B5B8609